MMSKATRGALWTITGVCVLAAGSLSRGQDFTPKPSAQHEMLAKNVGVWDATIKSWFQGPGADAIESKGVETVKLMPGGLWVLSEFDGSVGGMDFHGAGATGYDLTKKKFVGTWVDSMSASPMMTEGEYDPQTKTTTMYSTISGPDGKPARIRLTEVQKDEDHRLFTMAMQEGDSKDEFVKAMEISYVRRPGKPAAPAQP